MAFPTSSTWNLADFNETSLGQFPSLGSADLSLSPSTLPYLTYDTTNKYLKIRSADGQLFTADLNLPVSSSFSFEMLVRFTEMPNDTADIAGHAIGFQMSDDASRGLAVYFAQTGIAISRIDDFGSVTALPDSGDFTREIFRFFHRIRVAVDGALGRAYIFIGREDDPFPELRFIVPVQETPGAVGDRVRILAKGDALQAASIELKSFRVATGLQIGNFPPTANAGPDRVVAAGQAARLDGRRSYDLEGAELSYRWRPTDAPLGSSFVHEGYSLNTVDDGDADGATTQASVPAGSLPSWVGPDDVLVVQDLRLTLAAADSVAGTLSTVRDALPDDLSSQPFRIIRKTLLVDETKETPYCVPDVQGIYRFELVVNDGTSDSEPSEVLVNVLGARAPLGVEPAVEVLWNTIGDDWQYVENRRVFEEFWRGTAQVLSGKLLEAWQYHYNLSLRDAQTTFQRKWAAYPTLIAEGDSESVEYRYRNLSGSAGALVTDRSYWVGDGHDLSSVTAGDLLVLNNGQSFTIDRVLSSDSDPGPNQRLLLRDPLPFDASAEWEIPSLVISSSTDYEREGSYPGDLLKVEVFDTETSSYEDLTATVVAQKGMKVGATFTAELSAALSDTDRYELRLIGVKRRKALSLVPGTVSVPRLQNVIPQTQGPTIWNQHIDYIIEPFYREDDESPIPMLQFRDSVFIEPDVEPPDVFWAELVIDSNETNVENLFGRLAGFLKDDGEALGDDFNYVAGVAGLLYAQRRGPTPEAMRTGAQILLGQPFAEVAGRIEEIRPDFSPEKGRILIRDADGFDPPQSDVVRSYLYKKDPLDSSFTSGIEVNPTTGQVYAEGDDIAQFAPIGKGVTVSDLKNDPDWFIPFVRSGVITEIEKFNSFTLNFNLDLVTLANLVLLQQFIYRTKPTYTSPILLGLRNHEDDIDPVDNVSGRIRMLRYERVLGFKPYVIGAFRGDGTSWQPIGSAGVYIGGWVDAPSDLVELCFTISWPGGIITLGSIFVVGASVIDVDGAYTGTPGNSFTPTVGLNLPAGDYKVCRFVDAGNSVIP